MGFKRFLSVFSFCVFLNFLALFGTDVKPWFGNNLEFLMRYDVSYLGYHHVNSRGNLKKKGDDAIFADASLSVAGFDLLAIEAELLFAKTKRHRNFGVEAPRLTIRYLALDDILGDPVSMTLGFTFTAPVKASRHDISEFHFGRFEYELHAALGKETPYRETWQSRWWAVLFAGVADRGSPWIKGEAAWERNYCDALTLRFFVASQYGFGQHALLHHHPFPGYGGIKFRTLDAGVRCSCMLCSGICLSAQYDHRLYAYNAPAFANYITLYLFIPFSI